MLRRVFCLLLIIFLMIPFSVHAQEETAFQNEAHIWEYLIELTDNPAAAAGIMGNLYYESGLDPMALEAGIQVPMEKHDYTRFAQSGEYQAFLQDGIGYGLAQWSFPERKLQLLEMAEAQSCSIGDLDLQLQLLADELEQYNMLYRISHTDCIRFASDYFLLNFENPNIQDETVKLERASKAQYYYDKFTAPAAPEDGLTQAQRDVKQIASNSAAYGIPARNGYCMAWVTAVYREAGHSILPSGSASASAEAFLASRDLSSIPVGAAIYGRSNQKYGHVGIYVGDGMVYHNVGTAVSQELESWISQYDGFCWGWPGGMDLTSCS